MARPGARCRNGAAAFVRGDVAALLNKDGDRAFHRGGLEAHGGVVEPWLNVSAHGEHGSLK
jgi:hypothetical protein